MINFEKFNPEQPVFVQNIDIMDISNCQRSQEIIARYIELFNRSTMQVVIVPSDVSSFECVYSGKYDTISKLIPLLKEVRDINNSSMSEENINMLDEIITYYQRNEVIDDLIK